MHTAQATALHDSAEGPLLAAAVLDQGTPRTTPSHRHARGQLFGAVRSLLSVAVEMGVEVQADASDLRAGQWVVPASHALWVPPRHLHGLQSHGAFHGWSVYIAESACAALPPQPCLLRTSGLLREAVARAATWPPGPLDAAQTRVAAVLMDEISSLPHEPFGLPMPRDTRLLRMARALAEAPGDVRTLEAWADVIGMAPRSLMRRFAVETGFSFSAWRQRARLMRALEMLAARAPVTTVALDLGYDNVSAFIAMFRRSLGVTPGQYFGDRHGLGRD
ncbi:AraC family transcriptional regulator [Rhodoferax sp.]|uniref:AraC family transcriptional regulator n=1 Tax=Rhodoferax sp. TaxID=50421 RepID=UPI00374CEB84